MALLSDYKDTAKLVGNDVRFFGSDNSTQILQPGESIDLFLDVLGGVITVFVESYDNTDPTYTREVGPRADPTLQTYYRCVPATVTLTRAEDDATPVLKRTTLAGDQLEENHELTAELDAGAFKSTPTRWHLNVTNTSHQSASVQAGLMGCRDIAGVTTTRIPRRVLDHAFHVTLDAVAPYVYASGNTLHFGFSPEIAQLLDLGDNHALVKQTVDLGSITAEGALQRKSLSLVTGADLRAVIEETWRETNRVLTAMSSPYVAAAIKANNEWKEEWFGKINNDFIVLRALAEFSDIDIETTIIPGFEIDLGEVTDATFQIFIAFPTVAPSSGYLFVSTPAKLHGLVAAARSLGIVPTIADLIQSNLEEKLQPHMWLVHKYFAEILGRMSAFLPLPTVFIDADIDDTSVNVRFTIDPLEQRKTRPQPHVAAPGEPLRPGMVVHVHVPHAAELGAAPRPGETVAGPAVDPGPRGVPPTSFAMGDEASVTRLDHLHTMVFIMMENRSYDHMIGYLRTVRGEQYLGFSESDSNSYQDRGVSHTVTMQPIKNVVLTGREMAIDAQPHHDYKNVTLQVADGLMSGFAQNLLDRADPPQALSYYTDDLIPNYFKLAADHLVCNHWYSAHPGPTYPNRWATLTGTIPGLENLGDTDPNLGFMRQPTIFELLTEVGVDWVYFENNVSMIRMYAQYRLDDTHVIPYDDPKEGFAVRAKEGRLPPVVFIEPMITGVPPLAMSSDDHPPANVAMGQAFITEVYNTLIASPHWATTALTITYDEHGGFYDHVPPPGTTHGPADWRGKVPAIMSGGPTHMGVRVPTFVISPYVDPGTVSNAVFDHTSIIKSILVRHRDKLNTAQFSRFGPRVDMINHLGMALNRSTPRPHAPEALPPPPRRAMPDRGSSHESRAVRSPTTPSGDDPFHASLARAMLPRKANKPT